MNNPNIIFIVLDALRADKVLSNHNNIELTPFISELLQNSIYFKNAIANGPWTLPSHMAMFTGLYSSQIKVISGKHKWISNKIPILAEILKTNGYFTFCFSENVIVSRQFGLTRGFDMVFKSWKYASHRISKSNRINQLTKIIKFLDSIIIKRVKFKKILNFWQKIKNRTEKLTNSMRRTFFWKEIIFEYTDTLNDLVKIKQIIKKKEKNNSFFLFFNIMATHHPYLPTKEVLEYFGITFKDLKIIKDFLFNPRKDDFDINLKSKRFSEKKIKVINKLYNASVFYADLIIKHIFSILKDLGLLENSYVIITSDHGEYLFGQMDHNLWGHQTFHSVYDSLLKVPLIIYNNNFKEKVIKNQIAMKDLFHTILHLAEIPDNVYLKLNESLISQINSNFTSEYVFGEYIKVTRGMLGITNILRKTINKSLVPKIVRDIYYLRNETHKYVKYGNKIEEFYDLLINPNEEFNPINKNDEVYRKMKQFTGKIIKQNMDSDNLMSIITKKEEETIKSIISRRKLIGI